VPVPETSTAMGRGATGSMDTARTIAVTQLTLSAAGAQQTTVSVNGCDLDSFPDTQLTIG
jgi:hypothetical protein